jgi:tetratricopeptide (TPR) repeat protein
MSRFVGFAVGLALLGAPLRGAWADEPAATGASANGASGNGTAPAASGAEASRVAEAKANYDAGVKAYQNGRYNDAVRFFGEADRLAPSAPLSFNIARVHARAGDASQALRFYRDYLRRAPNAANAGEVREIVKKYEAELASAGKQQLSVLTTPNGASALVNGSAVGRTPWTRDLAPGEYRVELSHPGYASVARVVTLSLDHAEDVIVELEALPDAPAARGTTGTTSPALGPAKAETTPERETTKAAGFGAWPWVTLGVGGAALGGALAFELSRDSAEDAARREPRQIAFSEKLDQMESRKTTARVLASIGGALVLTGGVLLALDLWQDGQGGAAFASVLLDPSQCAASVTGAF